MPAKSKSQQRLFAMALAQKRGKMKGASKKVKELAEEMPEKELELFAKTKHKGLKENFILTFSEFVNEATVDKEGIHGLEFTPEEELEIVAYEDIAQIVHFLRRLDGEGVSYRVDGGFIYFKFAFNDAEYIIEIDLDSDTCSVARIYHTKGAIVYRGSALELLDQLAVHGLDLLKNQ